MLVKVVSPFHVNSMKECQDTIIAIKGQLKSSEVVYHLVESMQQIAFQASLLLHLFPIKFRY